MASTNKRWLGKIGAEASAPLQLTGSLITAHTHLEGFDDAPHRGTGSKNGSCGSICAQRGICKAIILLMLSYFVYLELD